MSVDLQALTIDAKRLWRGEAPFDGNLAIVDLDAGAEWPSDIRLPACPVIGTGARDHPLAPLLDAVLEPPIRLESLARQVLARPNAAAAIVHLLRLLPSLDVEDALTAESMAYGLLQGSGAHRAWLASRSGNGWPERSSRSVRVERLGDHLAIRLDHPESGNAIDRSMRDALHEAFAVAAFDHSIASVQLCAAGRAFSTGAELAEFGTTTDPATAHAIRMQTLPARMIAHCADRLQVHVQGACIGAGLEMAAWAQRVTAAPNAWFQLPELAMGVLPGAGGCVSLTRRIGRQRTALLILSGKRLNAQAALQWGLIDEILHQPA